MERLWAPWRMAYIKSEKPEGCVFCAAVAAEDPAEHFVLFRDDSCFAIMNRYPYTNAHLLILPNTHIPSLLDLEPALAARLTALLQASTAILERELGPDGFNIGMNCGDSAGQTVYHAHIHLIPRRDGDTPNPRGGVRGVIPDKMDY